jgi:hypothetical protein
MAKKKKSKSQASLTETVRANAAQADMQAYDSSGFNPDYSDVIKDLKRIATLAIIFLTFLVILSFII